MDLPDNTTIGEVVTLGIDLLAAKQYYVACSALIAYDWLLTLKDELRLIWTGKKGPIFVLFLMNRYIPMMFMVVTLFAYFSPAWTRHVCERFAIVEWVQALLISIQAELILLFRTYALTNRNKILASFLSCIMITQCVVVFYAMSRRGENSALPLPHFAVDSFHICVLYSNPAMDTAYLALTIAFDFTVFLATFVVTIRASPTKLDLAQSTLHGSIFRYGTLYFFVIFSGNLVWMILSLTARPGVKLMNAQPSMLFTSIMVTRLTLSLRDVAYKLQPDRWSLQTFDLNFPSAIVSRGLVSKVGNLGMQQTEGDSTAEVTSENSRCKSPADPNTV